MHMHLASVALTIIQRQVVIPGEQHLTPVDASGLLCPAVIWLRVVPARHLLVSLVCLILQATHGLPPLRFPAATVNQPSLPLILVAKSGSPCRSQITLVCMTLSLKVLTAGLYRQ